MEKMNANNGWIKLHRKITDDPMYFSETFTRMQAWIDMILLANYSEGFFYIRGNKVTVNRGQIGYSQESLAKRWKWSRGKVRRFLKQLENDGKIVQQKSSVITLISIVNYDAYQSDGTTDSTTDGRQTDINKKNKKNKNNISYTNSNEIYDFESFWNDYDKRVGNKEKLAKLWSKISDDDKLKIKIFIPRYKAAYPDKQYRLNPEKFLIDKRWNDEAIESKQSVEPTKRYKMLI